MSMKFCFSDENCLHCSQLCYIAINAYALYILYNMQIYMQAILKREDGSQWWEQWWWSHLVPLAEDLHDLVRPESENTDLR